MMRVISCLALSASLVLGFGACTSSDTAAGPQVPVGAGGVEDTSIPPFELQDAGVGDAGLTDGVDDAGPGDDGGAQTDAGGTDDADAGGEPPATCCENPGICPEGTACDLTGCGCLPIAAGECDNVGDPCDPQALEPAPFTCVAYGDAGLGVCRYACFGPPLVEDPNNPWQDNCPEGSQCGALKGTDGYCVPIECSGFFNNDCGEDATCLPLNIGTSNDATCVPDGSGDLGDVCVEHNDCGHNLLCVDFVCAKPDCTPLSNAQPCDGDATCVPMLVEGNELDIGTCSIACDVFFPDQCPDNTWCYPILNLPDEGASTVDGTCTSVYGQGVEGQVCEQDPNLCGVDLTCVKDSLEPATCQKLCDPTPAPPAFYGTCADGKGCAPVLLTNEESEVVTPLDFGTCVEDCPPFVPNEESGCGPTKWCVPTIFNSEVGECKGDVGPLGKGAACDSLVTETTCQAGSLCMGVSFGQALSGTCKVLCDPEAAAGGIGDTCEAGETCKELGFLGADDQAFYVDAGICETE